MVGLVVVSHSATLAAGVVELASQMAGPEVRVEAAGGLAGEDALGTDATLVLAAVERADVGDGVLVLMDIGSAVLSAETALDLLDEDVRRRVALTAAPLVEGAVAAAAAAAAGMSLAEVAAEAAGGLAAKDEVLGAPAPEPAEVAAEGGDWQTVRLRVRLPHGLHARPAARVVRLAAGFDATVEAARGDGTRGPVSARSLNALATLGIRSGEELVLRATGRQVAEALAALQELAERDFGERAAEPAPAAPIAAPAAVGEIAGLAASPGIAIAPAHHVLRRPLRLPTAPSGPPPAERAALDEALAAVREELERERASLADRAGADAADILDVHLLMLEDERLLSEARGAVEAGAPAARAWLEAAEREAGAYEQLDDPVQRGRAADVRDVGRRVAVRLGGGGELVLPPERGVLVADDLAPGQTARLDRSTVAGIATAGGGPTSHSAILARALGVPAVVALGPAILDVPEGAQLLLDGDTGRVAVAPDEVAVRRASHRRHEDERAEREALEAAAEPAVTRDGERVHVLANVGTPVDAELAVACGAEGIGLLRSEFLFLDRDELPDAREQAAVLEEIAARMGGRPVTLRALDVGGDKPLPALRQPHEENPFLGVRGVRLLLERPELLDTQLAAAAAVAERHPLRVMLPMVSSPRELAAVRARAPAGLELGAMVEVPAAALAIRQLAGEADFLSLGTNDLAQYTMAADRGQREVAALADPLEPAVLTLVALTTEGAAAAARPVAVCGEAAGDRLAVPILVGLGIRELSVAPRAVPRVKQLVRTLDAAAAGALAQEALRLDGAAAVRARAQEWLDRAEVAP